MFAHHMMSKPLATGLILSLPFLALPARSADSSATLSGSIVWAADKAPLAGSKLHAGDPKTGEVFSSAPAGAEGSFVLDDLPASTYELAVESDGGLYLVGTPLTLAPGTAQTLNLAVSRQTLPNYDKEDDDDPRGSPIWDNPGVTALVVVGAVVIIGLLFGQSDSNDPPPVVSGSQPGS